MVDLSYDPDEIITTSVTPTKLIASSEGVIASSQTWEKLSVLIFVYLPKTSQQDVIWKLMNILLVIFVLLEKIQYKLPHAYRLIFREKILLYVLLVQIHTPCQFYNYKVAYRCHLDTEVDINGMNVFVANWYKDTTKRESIIISKYELHFRSLRP